MAVIGWMDPAVRGIVLPQLDLQNMKQIPLLSVSGGLIGSMAMAGSISLDPMAPATSSTSDAFAQARRPISNPTLFDLALPGTNLHPIYIHHRLPDRITLAGGAEAPLGGEVEVYALQFEFAVNERMSIVATKDGYIDMDFDQTLQDKNGFANLGAGLKYAFILDPATRTALSGTMTLELP
ncbi:MAG: hypothetical protein ACO3RV_09930, partial [Luteolibacter sp.]